jgi:hypothetical protein
VSPRELVFGKATKNQVIASILPMKKNIRCLLMILCLGQLGLLHAQGYQALHGSSYTGSTSAYNNPASPVNYLQNWELTFLAVQAKATTNAATMQDFNTIKITDGYFSRFAHANQDMGLLNFLYKIDERKALTVNFRMRNYLHAKSQPFNYIDSVTTTMNRFFVVNRNTPFIEAFGTHSGWLELGLNYSQVLHETDHDRLTGGLTLQLQKGISGATVKVNKLSYLEQKNGTDTTYTFTGGGGSLAYGDSYESEDMKDFLKRSMLSLGISMGIEYLVYQPGANTGGSTPNYDWKIGLSLMDLGANVYRSGSSSTSFSNPNTTISDVTLDNKLSGANTLGDVADSLATIFTNTAGVASNFKISNPTRLILNVDRNLGNNFFVNGELSMNFFSTSSYKHLYTRELNLFTLTPRWETAEFGVYLPMQYTTQGQFWFGAAVKLGPLVVGMHNLGMLKKDTEINGGGYMLLSIHPFRSKKAISKLDCF